MDGTVRLHVEARGPLASTVEPFAVEDEAQLVGLVDEEVRAGEGDRAFFQDAVGHKLADVGFLGVVAELKLGR